MTSFSQEYNSHSNNLLVVSEDGKPIIQTREIHKFPENAEKIIKNRDNLINQTGHLVTDLFKGYLSIPNKTIEIIFDNNIQKGLEEGKYILMSSKKGGFYTDAINKTTKKISGKGRIVETGKLNQVGVCVYQIMSIAVAQSHLSDIDEKLGEIKNLISDIKENQKNEELANIEGKISYLKEIYDDIKKTSKRDIPLQKKNAIEDIIKDFYIIEAKQRKDIDSLVKKIKNIKNSDWFGTGNSFNEIKKSVIDANNIISKINLLADLSLIIKIVKTCIDPLENNFSSIRWDIDEFNSKFKDYQISIKEKSNELISRSIWNTEDTLINRQENIELLLKNQDSYFYRIESEYKNVNKKIEKKAQEIIDKKNLRMAISFDENGKIKKSGFF